MKYPEKPFGCKICKTAFVSLELLGKHFEESHESENRFEKQIFLGFGGEDLDPVYG